MAEIKEKAVKAEYKSAKRSRKMIREAFLSLLKEKSTNKITVTDIVTLADINRTTFYAHYSDVRGVIEEMENEIIDKMMEILKDFHYFSFFKNPTPLFLRVCYFLKGDIDLYKLLIHADGSEEFLEKIKKIFADFMMNDPDIPQYIRDKKSFAIRVCYFSGGIVNTVKQWFYDELDCSLNDIFTEIATLISETDLS